LPADFFGGAGGTAQSPAASPDLAALADDRQALTRRLDRLCGQASAKAESYIESRQQLLAAEAFLDLAPRAAARLEDLTRELFGEVLDEIETDLTHAVREILGQNRTVVTRRDVKNGKLVIEFEMEQDGKTEDIYVGQGGSVCNILSVGLRLVALSQLDPERHRPFLVLDEQDCWLRPDLVPGFVRLIAAIADRLGIQVLYISHHPVDLFALEARRVFGLRPGRENGPTLAVLADRPARADGSATLPGLEANGQTAPGGE
jgi:predicted ATPase